MTRRRKLLLAATAAVLLLGGGIYWLVATEAGLRFVWGRVRALSPVPMEGEVGGQLVGPLRVEHLRMELRRAKVEVASADLDWDPWGLFQGRLSFTQSRINELTVTYKPRAAGEPAGAPRIPAPPIPVELHGKVVGLNVRWSAERQLRFAQLSLHAVGGPRTLEIHSLALDGYGAHLEASGKVGLRLDGEVQLATRWFYQPPQGEQVRGHGTLTGTLSRPRAEQLFDTVLRGEANGRLIWIDRPVSWRAEVNSQPVSIDRLHRGWRALEVGGRLLAEGKAGDLRGTAQGTLRDPAAGAWNFEAQAIRQESGWRLPQLALAAQQGKGRVAASGELRTAGSAAVALDVEWSDLGWPVAASVPAVQSPRGRVTVQGNLDNYTIDGHAALARAGLPDGEVELTGQGDRNGMALSQLHARWLDGELIGTGRLRWRPSLSWSAELRANEIDPGRWRTGWNGRLGGRITTEGETRNGKLHMQLALAELAGQLRGQPLTGAGRFTVDGAQLRVEGLALQAGSAQLQAEGDLGARWNLRWQLAGARIEDLVPGMSGQLQASGLVEGKGDAPWVRAEATGERLAWQGHSAARLQLNADVDLTGAHPWELRLEGDDLATASGVAAERLTLTGQGGPADHRLVLDAATAGRSLHWVAEGRYGERSWRGRLLEGRAEDPQLGVWLQGATAGLTLGPGEVRLEETCWVQGEARLCLVLDGEGKRGWRGKTHVKDFPLAALQPLLHRDFYLSGLLDADGTFLYRDGLRALDLDLAARDGDFRFQVSEQEQIVTPYRRLDLKARAGEAGASLSTGLNLVNGDHANGELTLPRWQPGDGFGAGQPLRGSAEASLGELVWVSLLAPELVATGRLESTFTVRGTLGKPLFQGKAELAGGKLAVPLLGIALKDLSVDARPDGEEMAVHAQARSGPGQLTLSGRMSGDAKGWRLLLDAQGKNVEVARLPKAHVLVTPDLHAEVRRGLIHLRGTLLVPQANIDLGGIEAPVQASPDVVLVDHPESAAARAPRWKITSELEVRFGDQVRLTGYGFSGRLGGRITIVEEATGEALGRGELAILNGKYEAYGQDLTIEQGRLLYGNVPLNNPGIDFRAVREVDAVDEAETVKVGVVATGRLKKPQVRLYSDPAMDDTAVLSYLVLGRPLDTASKEDANMLQQAALGLGVAGGTEVARRVANEVGVDVVTVQANGDKQEGAVVLGKYLSPRLYVEYAVGFWESGDAWQLRYRLDDNWTLEGESGVQSGVDLLYTIEK